MAEANPIALARTAIARGQQTWLLWIRGPLQLQLQRVRWSQARFHERVCQDERLSILGVTEFTSSDSIGIISETQGPWKGLSPGRSRICPLEGAQSVPWKEPSLSPGRS